MQVSLQALLQVVTQQRNDALDGLAAATAAVSSLQVKTKELEEKVAALTPAEPAKTGES